MKEIVTCLIFVFVFTLSLTAQQTKRSSGTYQVRVEDNMTREEARRKAEELAKIDAITNAFGQYVGQETNLTVQDGRSSFNIIGTTKVKGEWVRELSKTFEEESRSEKTTFGTVQTQWITCKIRGVVKEATPKANIEYRTLNQTNPASRSSSFYSGERFYLWFRSPVDGYLSVYLQDEDTVYRLLPYDDMASMSSIKVEADKEYLFFSTSDEHDYFNNIIDKIELFTPRRIDLNTVHILFSEKYYPKPVLDNSVKQPDKSIVPKSLTKIEFERWLAGNKTSISDFLDDQVYIEILREK